MDHLSQSLLGEQQMAVPERTPFDAMDVNFNKPGARTDFSPPCRRVRLDILKTLSIDPSNEPKTRL